ncbi:MAG: riboflavin kinase [Candidatus Roizmanbacteria bacterium]
MKLFSTHQVSGLGRGKKILVPTINVAIPPDFGYKHGIYAGYILLTDTKTGETKQYPAAIHYGPKPTFTDQDISLELNIIDVEPQNIISYDPARISFAMISYIRPVQAFVDAPSLLRQIGLDIQNIRNVLSGDQIKV